MTKHSVVLSSEVAAKSETTTNEEGFHEAIDAINSEAHALPMITKTKPKNHALRHRVVLWKTTKRQSAFEESALDECSKRNKVDVAESSTISKKQWNNLKPLSRKGRTAQSSSPSPTSPWWQGAGDMEDQDRERACQR